MGVTREKVSVCVARYEKLSGKAVKDMAIESGMGKPRSNANARVPGIRAKTKTSKNKPRRMRGGMGEGGRGQRSEQ